MASISGKDQHQLDSAPQGTAKEMRVRGIICFQKEVEEPLTVVLEPSFKLPVLLLDGAQLLLVSTYFLF